MTHRLILRLPAFCLLFALVDAISPRVRADTTFAPDDKGRAIAERFYRSDDGFGTSSARLTMTLADSGGRATVRELQIDTLEKTEPGLGDRSLTRFFSPPDVEGTLLLSHAKILEPDDQWLYLPSLRRVKRISSANKSGPFVGSEFSFEDLTSNELDKFAYAYARTEKLGELTVDVLEARPLYERSGYSRLTYYIDTEVFQLRRVEFHDRGGRLFKTLDLTEYRLHENRFWRPLVQTMNNHLTGKSTVLRFRDYTFGVDLDRRDFEPAALTRR